MQARAIPTRHARCELRFRHALTRLVMHPARPDPPPRTPSPRLPATKSDAGQGTRAGRPHAERVLAVQRLAQQTRAGSRSVWAGWPARIVLNALGQAGPRDPRGSHAQETTRPSYKGRSHSRVHVARQRLRAWVWDEPGRAAPRSKGRPVIGTAPQPEWPGLSGSGPG